jgi:hypothetical protein
MDILVFKESLNEPSTHVYIGDAVHPGPEVNLTAVQRQLLHAAVMDAVRTFRETEQ